MKFLILIILSLVTAKECGNNPPSQTLTIQDFETPVIEYNEYTRGYQHSIKIEKQEIEIFTDLRGKISTQKRDISEKDWEELISIFQKTDLEIINELKAPSNLSATDVAKAAKIKITFREKIYECRGFDSGNPPVEIKELTDKVIVLSKEK